MNQPPKGPPGQKNTPKPLIAHKYVDGHKAKLQTALDSSKLSPDVVLLRQSQTALLNGQTSSRYREEFFDQAFIDILSEYFKQWLTSAPEEVKKREFLYQAALNLGEVKSTLLRFEMFGRNVSGMIQNQQPNAGEAGQEGNQDDEADAQ